MTKTLLFTAAIALLGLGGMAQAERMIYRSARSISSGYAYDINSSGQVVGGSGGKPFLWDSQSGITRIDMPSGSSSGMAWGLNDLGEVVGHYNDGKVKAFKWSSKSGAIDISGSLQQTLARDIGNDGVVVGEAHDSAYQFCGSMWTASSGWIQTGLNEALSINNVGMMAGVVGNSAALWSTQTGLITIMIPGSTRANATEVNNQGQVVGMYDDTSGHNRAFYWSPLSGLTVLPMLEGYNHSVANGINSSGQVVGVLAKLDPILPDIKQAFVWSADDGFVLLGEGDAQAINDAGLIVGSQNQGGSATAVVWEPVPEPSSIILLGGLAGLIGLRRRKA